MIDYTEKTVFVGIDVHKKTYAVTCLCEGQVVKRDTLMARPERLGEYLQKYFPGAHLKTVYEAGFSGFALHRYLLEIGIDSQVVHAAGVEVAAHNRVKTDKRDSLKLAVQLASGRLKGIHVPTPQREAYREVSRLREKVTKDKTRVGNRLKSLLYRQGLISAEDKQVVCKTWIQKVAALATPLSIAICIQQCVEQWLNLDDKLKVIDKHLAEQAKTDHELEKIYQSVPGIGAVSARVLANELEDMGHFRNEKQLFGFTGLTPSEYSSGEHKRQGHITHQGRPLLRKTLVQASWRAIQIDEGLRFTFERIAKKAGKKRAIVGIARRLIGHIRACFKHDVLYATQLVKREYSVIANEGSSLAVAT
jgi:transposase